MSSSRPTDCASMNSSENTQNHLRLRMEARPRRLTVMVTIALALVSFVSCTTSKTAKPQDSGVTETTAQPAAQEGWSAKMQQLSETLSSLLPLVSSKTKFNDDKNQKRIEENTQRLRNLAHGLKKAEAPSADPSLKVMTGLFEEDISRALESLQSGNREYARHILKDTTSYCIQCHTQTGNGPEFPRLNLKINTAELNPLEQAEFFAATRQFDSALEAYGKVLASEALAKADPFEWEQAARSALAIVVRVKSDPKKTLALINQIEKNTALPPATKKITAAWHKSVNEWAKEKNPVLVSPQEKLQKAENLIKRAQNREEFPLDHSQDILYFRASSLLHDLLSAEGRRDNLTAQALYWSGVSSEATRDMNFWTLHETLYEKCIQEVPHTELARKCFARLKDSVTLGYSGSGGVNVPASVQKRLDAFQAQAQPQAETPK